MCFECKNETKDPLKLIFSLTRAQLAGVKVDLLTQQFIQIYPVKLGVVVACKINWSNISCLVNLNFYLKWAQLVMKGVENNL